ncbi:Clp protease N-terminal domain-containing protein [Kribbella sp. NPDC055071]
MRYLSRYDVLAVVARILQCESEDAVRRTDLDTVTRVLDDVRLAGGLAEAAGVLLAGLVRRRPFGGANRVVAMAVVLQFVSLNRAELRLEPVAEVDELLDGVVAGGLTDREVGAFIAARLSSGSASSRSVSAGELQDHLRLDLDLMIENAVQDIEDEWYGGVQMFERFSEPARHVVVLAQEEARGLGHDYIGTEHLLVALIEERHGIAAKVLAGEEPRSSHSAAGGITAESGISAASGITAPAVRDLIVEMLGRGRGSGRAVPFTPRAKTTLEYAWDEARRRDCEKLDTEHLLLGLLRDGEGVAVQILTKLISDPDQLRRKVQDWIDHRQRVETAVTGMLADDNPGWAAFGRRHHLLAELNAVLDENERLHEQVARLRDLLRRHDIDPG